MSCGKEVTGDGKWCPSCAETLQKIKNAQVSKSASPASSAMGCLLLAAIALGVGYFVKSAVTNGGSQSSTLTSQPSPSPASNTPASTVVDVAGFVDDMKSGFRDTVVRSLVVEDGTVKIQLADAPVKYFSGLIGMTCTFASAHNLQLRQLRILDSNGRGWAYQLTPGSCQEVIEHTTNQRMEEGRNSLDAFIERHRRPITRMDKSPW